MAHAHAQRNVWIRWQHTLTLSTCFNFSLCSWSFMLHHHTALLHVTNWFHYGWSEGSRRNKKKNYRVESTIGDMVYGVMQPWSYIYLCVLKGKKFNASPHSTLNSSRREENWFKFSGKAGTRKRKWPIVISMWGGKPWGVVNTSKERNQETLMVIQIQLRPMQTLQAKVRTFTNGPVLSCLPRSQATY